MPGEVHAIDIYGDSPARAQVGRLPSFGPSLIDNLGNAKEPRRARIQATVTARRSSAPIAVPLLRLLRILHAVIFLSPRALQVDR